jgi:hypothetical protein
MFKIDVDSTEAHRFLTDFEREQIPFARVLAATRTAQRVKAGMLKVMRGRLDRPTSTTMNSLFIRPATKAKPEARVWFKDSWTTGIPADRYLQQAVHGGLRRHKRFEEALIAGGLMRRGQYAVPASDMLNAYGNAPRGLITKVLSGLGAAEQRRGYQANATSSRRSRRKGNAQRYFVAEIEGTQGIWERRSTAWGDAVRPVFVFTNGAPGYRVIFPFHTIAENIVKAHYGNELRDALAEAVRTAR